MEVRKKNFYFPAGSKTEVKLKTNFKNKIKINKFVNYSIRRK